MVRLLTLGTVAGLTIAASANAADMGYKDSYAGSWTGFYIGVNGGYAWDAISPHGGVEDNGGFGGGQTGFNWQTAIGMGSYLVLGAEADFQGTGIDHTGNGSLSFLHGLVIDRDLHTRSIDYFGTVRGRVGFACGPALLYGTGGLAYGNEKNIFKDLVTNNVFQANGIQTGFAAGGGFEYKLRAGWSFKTEYQHVELDADRPVGNAGFVTTRKTELDTVRGGLNYHF
jgi:outer membrane immunogenic protein